MKELKRVIKAEKIAYRNKIEEDFTYNNMKRLWEGMRLVSGYSNASSKSSQLPDCNAKYANELNTFYDHFDKHDFSIEHKNLCDIICDLDSNDYDLSVTEDEVR